MNTITNASPSTIICARTQDLPYDLKRILRVQWKEFINFVEDAQLMRCKTAGTDVNVTQGRFKPTAKSAAA